MRQIYIILIISAIFLPRANSQVSGYMGKKFFFVADANLTPAYYYGNAKHQHGAFNFAMNPSISAEYVILRNRDIGFCARFIRSSYEYNCPVFYKNDRYDISKVYGDIRGIAWSVYGVRYLVPNAIAPLGGYLRTDLGIVKYRSNLDINALHQAMLEQNPHLTTFPVFDEFRESSPFIGFTYGTHLVYYDKFVLSYGWQFGFVIKCFGEALVSLFPEEDEIEIYDDYIAHKTRSPVGGSYMISFNVGVGLLPF